MIILQDTLMQLNEKHSSKSASSPSSFFKSKWLEERDMRVRYKNLNLENLSEVVKERMQVSDEQKSEFECYEELKDMKRANEVSIFNKLRGIVKSYRKLEFQKFAHELECLDCLYHLHNQKIINYQTVKSLFQSLKQIEKYCQKIKKELVRAQKNTKKTGEMTPSEIVLKNDDGLNIPATNIYEEFSIIADECNFLKGFNITRSDQSSLFPEMDAEEINLDYFLITLRNLFNCLDLENFDVRDINLELRSFCWEGISQTPSINNTPYASFIRAFKRIEDKQEVYFGLSNVIRSADFYNVRNQIIQF
tara:strand:- start:3150 stop:4067 length:918 start_codon:yes stop_codon:yes gene_type:complete